MTERTPVPRDPGDDHSRAMAEKRRTFVTEQTGAGLDHLGRYSFEPGVLRGNVENFAGVAQVPIGIAGPLLIDGEHARGEFSVPPATTEGTLVTSYNRGMRLLSESGGVRTTVVESYMQRSPVSVLDDARQAREFGAWLDEHLDAIRTTAEADHAHRTAAAHRAVAGRAAAVPAVQLHDRRRRRAEHDRQGDAGRLHLDPGRPPGPPALPAVGQRRHGQEALADEHAAHPWTAGGRRGGDQAGRAAPADAHRHDRPVREPDHLGDRGIPRRLGEQRGARRQRHRRARAVRTPPPCPSRTPASPTRLLDDGDYYWSMPLPSLIVATVGGGTGLPTQRECLEMLGCARPGKVEKFAEIVAAVVLAGETSLSSAILAGEWVDSHERLGRNRPG